VLNIWMEAVCSRSVKRVVDLYTENAVLVPTLNPGVLQGKRQLAAYFEKFLSKQDLCGRIDCVVTQSLGRADAPRQGQIYSGLYTFAWIELGSPKEIQARFTYVVVPTRRGWKILNHHSSAVPS